MTKVSRSATWRRSASPMGWPRVSLTFLKRSRSIMNKAQPFLRWAALRSASSSVCRIIARLGKLVSESNRARREISRSDRRCSVRSVPMPRKPRKRPRSSKIGFPESDQWTSCSLAGRTTTSEKGKRAERWNPRVLLSSVDSGPWSTDTKSVNWRPSSSPGSHWKSSASWRDT